MRFLTHRGTTGFGLSALFCLAPIAVLVDPAHRFVYHSSDSVTSLFGVVLAEMGLLWLLFALLLWGAECWRPLRRVVWGGILLFGPWLLVKEVMTAADWGLPHRVSLTLFWGPAVGGGVFLLLRRRSAALCFERGQQLASALLAGYALYGVLLVGQLIVGAWDVRGLNRPLPLHRQQLGQAVTRRGAGTAHGRVIWILLDELSYQQVYGERFPGLALPAFDALAGESTVFAHVVPAQIYTERVLPALMTGLPVDEIRSSDDGRRLDLHDPAARRWRRFDPQATIFADALDAGYKTGVVGWFNPYCRILPGVLDTCYWSFRTQREPGRNGDQTVRENLTDELSDLRERVTHFLSLKWVTLVGDQGEHLEDFRDLLVEGDERLEDGSVGFLLLHMPVPHPGGIYDRKRNEFVTQNASYIDNLALADHYLAHVRALLQARGEWDSSAVIVMGDHSWRTQAVWKGTPFWMAEDEAASHGGQFDDRPAYILKLPHQSQGARIEDTFSALRTRALLQGIVRGQIRSSEDLIQFVHGEPLHPVVAAVAAASRGVRAGR
jgi:hypothetical protein